MPRVIYSKEEVIADWKTGKYTERDIASKHKISPATAHNIVKGIEKTISKLVSKQIEINQELAEHTEQEVSKFKQEVEEQTRYIKFFNQAAIQNVQGAMKAGCDSQADFRARADTITKGREVVLGKTPDTVINNTNAQQTLKTITIIKAEEMA